MKKRITSILTVIIVTVILLGNNFFTYTVKAVSQVEDSTVKSDGIFRDNPQEIIDNDCGSNLFAEERGRYDTDYNLTSTGNIRNLVVFINFKDQVASKVYSPLDTSNLTSANPYANGSISQIKNAFNGTYYSVKGYMSEISNKKLLLTSDFYPKNANGNVITYQDSHPLGYYLKYSASNTIGYSAGESASRKGNLMLNALNSISSQISNPSIYDVNKDGILDYVTFVVPSMEEYGEILWPTTITYLNPIKVEKLGLSMRKAIFVTTPYLRKNSNSVNDMYKCIAHECLHMIGFEDMYDPSGYSSEILGPWTMMTNNYGHPTVYEKSKYGKWIYDIKNITDSGIYSISPNISNPDTNDVAYKLSVDGNDSYYMIEFRKKGSSIYEKDIPQSGLLVYKVNPCANGNTKGEPYEIITQKNEGKTASEALLNASNKSCTVSLTGDSGKIDFKIDYVSIKNGKINFKVTKTKAENIEYKLTILNLDTSVESPQPVNKAIKITANAIGGGPEKQYKFTIKDVRGNIVYSTSSSKNYCTWTPNKEDNYLIECEVQDGYDNSAKATKVFMVSNFRITGVKSNVASPQVLGKSIVLRAYSTGGENVNYRFLQVYNNTTKVIKNFSASSLCTWKPTVAGKYKLIIQAKNSNGKIYEKQLDYQILDNNLKIKSFTTDLSSPQELGKAITIKASAEGNKTVYYAYSIYLNGTLVGKKGYSTSTSVKWTPSKAGKYTLKLEVKDSTNEVVSKEISYEIKKPLTIKSFTTDLSSPQELGKAITIKASAEGNETVYYAYSIYLNGTLVGKKGYSTSTSIKWTPKKAGKYTLKLDVKDSTGSIVSKKLQFIIQ